MVFSSTLFVFVFLPLVLLINWAFNLTPRIVFRNTALLLASLLFYTWGEAYYVLIILVSIVLNYFFGRLLGRFGPKHRLILGLGIAANLSLLIYYKYFNFLVDNLNAVLKLLDISPLQTMPVHLPIGISFFTFQAISYLADIYREKVNVQKNPLTMGMYIAMFPQLIAGPIVRYETVEGTLQKRSVNWEDYAAGAKLFIIGLAKKVIIADTMARAADHIAELNHGDISTPLAWFFCLAYGLQIFFDFAGYSNMARGLGRIFGFHFPVNFNQPYSSRSIKEFWRRWHISLSTWFRDYVYIPLGGNRISNARTYVNLFIVFILTGVWHGASWNFLLWGLIHGLFLILERIPRIENLLDRSPGIIRHAYVLLVIMPAWVFFRIESISKAAPIAAHLFFPYFPTPYRPDMLLGYYIDNWFLLVFTAGFIFSLVRWNKFKGRWNVERDNISFVFLENAALALLFLFSLAAVISQSYSPFIYFRF